MEIKNLTEKDFFEFINSQTKPVLVDFYADWCGPCKMQAPIVDKIAEELSDKIVVAKANTDNCYGICLKYNIASIPTIILFKNGEIKETLIGLSDKSEISNIIIKYV